MIDPKELRIGAHINVNGERVVVDEITNTALVAYVTPDNDWAATDPAEDWIEPIPITAELLTELGFRLLTLKFGKFWIREDLGQIEEDKEWWTFDGDNDIHFHFQYLHELELFLYLTTKTELIKD